MITRSEHDGHVLEFTETEEDHFYTLNGELVPGATDVKLGFPKAYNLIKWEIGEGAKFVIDCLTDVRADGRYPKDQTLFPITEEGYDNLINGAKSATKKILEETADVGTIMHDYAFSLRVGKRFDDAKIQGHKDEALIRKRLLEVDAWCSERDKEEEVVSAEQIVASPLHMFAGKFDVLVRRKDTGALRVQDYKSAKGFYVEQFIQAGGYRQAMWEWQNQLPSELEVIRFNDNTEKPASLVISDFDSVESLTKQFLSCRQTRVFQRKWEPFFNKIYRQSIPKKVKAPK